MFYNLVCTIEYVIFNELCYLVSVEQFAGLDPMDSPSILEGHSSVKAGYHVSLSSTGGEGSNSNPSNMGSEHSSAVNGYPATSSADPGSNEPNSTGSVSPVPASPEPGSASEVPSSPVSSDLSMDSSDSGNPHHMQERLDLHEELED